jgi:hypothetical protein
VSIENDLITKVVLPLRGRKRRYSTADCMRRHIASRAVRPVGFAPPRRLDRRAIVCLRYVRHWPVA